MVQRSHSKASKGKRKEPAAPAAPASLPGEEAERAAAEQAAEQAAAQAAQAAEDSPDSPSPLSVWTCPCKLVTADRSEADASASMERRRKLQRSRMNSLTYRCVFFEPAFTACGFLASVGRLA
jgi:hypothetical protein